MLLINSSKKNINISVYYIFGCLRVGDPLRPICPRRGAVLIAVERAAEALGPSRVPASRVTDAEGEDWHGFDFRVRTVETEWRYEVKSSLDESFEFEFTQNEMRVAAECAADGPRKYRILYVPLVFSPEHWRVMELPNPMSETGRRLFQAIGSGATRFKFQVS